LSAVPVQVEQGRVGGGTPAALSHGVWSTGPDKVDGVTGADGGRVGLEDKCTTGTDGDGRCGSETDGGRESEEGGSGTHGVSR